LVDYYDYYKVAECCYLLCSLPSGALCLLDSMLVLDPSKRVTAEDALKNSWLSAVNYCMRLE